MVPAITLTKTGARVLVPSTVCTLLESDGLRRDVNVGSGFQVKFKSRHFTLYFEFIIGAAPD